MATPNTDWKAAMGTVLKVIGYTFQPDDEQNQRLLHLVSRYAELCDRLADTRRANPAFTFPSELKAVGEKQLAEEFSDIPKRYFNIASTPVMRKLRRSPDYEFVQEYDYMPVDLDSSTVSITLLPHRKITDEPVLHISIGADSGRRVIIPCEYELRLDDDPADDAGSARLYYFHHYNTWEVRVTANVDEERVLAAEIAQKRACGMCDG